MAEIKLTKNELRAQQTRLGQLEKYLPTLQLKKALLQIEVNEARVEIAKCAEEFNKVYADVESFSALLTEVLTIDLGDSAKITKVNKRYENIAGVEVPYFESIEFAEFTYSLFDTPIWVDTVTKGLRRLAEVKVRVEIAREKANALEKELREVSIRVNLFEKILIPRALAHIKKIRVFLGDLQLSAVSQAKAAKAKIENRKHKQMLSYAI
ncbi:MAG: V-type ATP synthase subunit D [Parachlamydiaceae bacterium]